MVASACNIIWILGCTMPRKRTLSWETENSTFAKRLKEIMQRNKINQTDLAKETGIQRQTISNYVNGQSVPDVNNLFKICQVLDVSADYLIGASDVISTEPIIRSMCDYTKLRENDVELLHVISEIDAPEGLGPLYIRMLGDIISSTSFIGAMHSISSAVWAKATMIDIQLSDENRKLINECDSKLRPLGYSAMSGREASELYKSRAVFSMNKLIEDVIDIEVELMRENMEPENSEVNNNG